MQIVSFRDSLHEKSNLVSWENVSVCCLLKFLPNVVLKELNMVFKVLSETKETSCMQEGFLNIFFSTNIK